MDRLWKETVTELDCQETREALQALGAASVN